MSELFAEREDMTIDRSRVVDIDIPGAFEQFVFDELAVHLPALRHKVN